MRKQNGAVCLGKRGVEKLIILNLYFRTVRVIFILFKPIHALFLKHSHI